MKVSSIVVLIVLIWACSGKQEVIETDPLQLRSEVPPTEVQTVPARKLPFDCTCSQASIRIFNTHYR